MRFPARALCRQRDKVAARAYGNRMFWRGQYWGFTSESARLRLGWVSKVVNQTIPVIDFLSRNGLELNSADHDVHLDIVEKPEILETLRAPIPEDCFATVNHWAYFSLNDAPPNEDPREC